LCQQENLSWDLAQRKSFVSLVNLITFSFVFISFSISIYYGLTLESFILSVVIPCWPLVNFCVVNNYENSESIRDKKGLATVIDAAIAESNPTRKTVRNVQDLIYLNRKNNALIFDWFYKIHKGT
ncbi:S-4TM family putative pore-forming effector, partial [Vibrio anguillarum]